MNDTSTTYERVNMTFPSTTAKYLRDRAAAELRTVSNMAAFMIEEYRRAHEEAGKTAPTGDTMKASDRAQAP